MTVEDVLDEARKHGFPAKPVRLVSVEINSQMLTEHPIIKTNRRPIGHAVVKTKEELEKKSIKVMGFSTMLHLMVIPSDDIGFWDPKNLNEQERNYVEL